MSDHVTLREIVTNLLYPPRCLLCGTLCGWEGLLCESCQKQQPQAGEYYGAPGTRGPVAPGGSSGNLRACGKACRFLAGC